MESRNARAYRWCQAVGAFQDSVITGCAGEMTPRQADDGLLELILPDGGQVLVRFGDGISLNPEIEATVVRMMLAATGSEHEVRAALTDYAEASGLKAVIARDRGSVTVVIA